MSNDHFFDQDIQFVQVDEDEKIVRSKDLIQLYPLGLSLAHNLEKPFLLLRDEKHEVTLPVAMTQLEAGVFISQTQKGSTSPHVFLEEILKSFQITLKKCVFVQLQPDSQMVRLYFSGHPVLSSLKLRADQVISLCLHFDVPFFASREFIQKSSLIQAKPQVSRLLNEGHSLLFDLPQKYLV